MSNEYSLLTVLEAASPRSRPQRACFCWEPASHSVDNVSSLRPHGGSLGGRRRSPLGPCHQGTAPGLGLHPRDPPHLPEAPPPNTITLGLGLQHVDFGDTFGPQQTVESCMAASTQLAPPEARTRARACSALPGTLQRFGLSDASAREHRVRGSEGVLLPDDGAPASDARLACLQETRS